MNSEQLYQLDNLHKQIENECRLLEVWEWDHNKLLELEHELDRVSREVYIIINNNK